MDASLESSSDLQSQVEEIEALSAIYGDEWCVIDEASRIFCIQISDGIYEPKWSVCLQIILPEDYPSSAPPIYQINAGWLRGPDRIKLSNSLEELYLENVGESILYLWVEKIREFLIERSQCGNTVEGPETGRAVTTEEEDEDWDEGNIPDYSALKLNTEQAHLFSSSSADEELPPIKHGEAITDRRSTFQPHLAPVVTPKQVQRVIDKLYENKKIASATHNIYAYRFWMCGMCLWWYRDGTVGSSSALTASNTSTTVPGISSSKRATQKRWMKHQEQEERAESPKARR
ncbi:protein IMPACT isoform X2 [Colossoma macropomum]|uniref:protein IMPACT isoform X2 n=1 Tax=Colossoma macropomum TaxID=42526 RepID=UPI0018652188|nr:protein IMPACT isoform X2 [Colossoma macropomum]